jgi:hypothetical protein
MPCPQFDRSHLHLKPLDERVHDLDLSVLRALDDRSDFVHAAIPKLARAMVEAKHRGRAVILSMGAHVLRCGNARLIIDLMRRGILSHIAMNGAGAIHDFEFALIGHTTESVERYIQTGQFGLWNETGRINDAVCTGHRRNMGMGEAIGRMIAEEAFPHRDISVLAAGLEWQVPVTVHVGVGYDIIHQHPNCDGAALGATSYRDFLCFTHAVAQLEGGVFLNIGTAVMGPEVYLKALSMARNVAHQRGESIKHFTTGVFDIIPLADDTEGEAPKTDPRYYYRPWKTVLVRTVKDGGVGHYVCGSHDETIPALYHAVLHAEENR